MMMKNCLLSAVFLLLLGVACTSDPNPPDLLPVPTKSEGPYLKVLGIAQDGGYPHAACEKDCCVPAWGEPSRRKMVSCIAVIDPASGRNWMLDATPDFKDQQHLLKAETGQDLSGIFLTHAHIGHYTGLMQLGREVIGTDQVPVYAMPRMLDYLQTNGPWSQLVSLNNIALQPLHADSSVQLTPEIRVTPFRVPHRDEYSETVGYRIDGPDRSAIFIPDIDKWEKWDRSIDSLIGTVDHAFLDGTFFQNGEIVGRDMSEIPHPFIRESMGRFQSAGIDPERVVFIHFNHTNPVMQANSPERQEVRKAGFSVAEEGEVWPL
ncbi:MBL fold metallo-hydrolase [Flavilitoribacter nigricans]|nr:MBL fold metallo-hydrolase [Flavilitoribacter nigricans]